MKKINQRLIVAETFYSLQGEGQTMGYPSVFLRLGGCNLLCKSESWVCDSIEVWQKGKAKDFENVLEENYIARLIDGAHLIITGGEPLIHSRSIIDYLIWFHSKYEFIPTVEIETNGTITPTTELLNLVDYWNVSPKLANSGESYLKRVNDIAIKTLNDQSDKTIFKFVIRDRDDFLDIIQDYGKFISMEKVYLMPAGSNTEELNETRKTVAELSVSCGVRYSERLHVVIWNQKTGV